MELNELSRSILRCAYLVHTTLGPGLLESAYEKCLYHELTDNGFNVERQMILPLEYKEVQIDAGYRLDLIVEDSVILEIKSVEALNDLHLAQILTYLKLSDCKLGLLLNFNVKYLKQGIRRVVNNF